MATNKLFGNHITPACKYCMEGFPGREESILCARHGVVAPDHKCRHFSYDPLSRVPKRPLPIPQYREEEFALD